MYAIYVDGQKRSFVYGSRKRALALLHYWRRETREISAKYGTSLQTMTLQKIG